MKKKSFESIVDETVSVNYTKNDMKRIDKKEIYKLKYYFNKKWKSSHRTISRFMKDNETWLDREINLFKKKINQVFKEKKTRIKVLYY